MKRVIIGLVLAMATAQTASAFDLESPKGITQQQWNQSSAYQNFQCPANTARGEGVDMNFTTNRSDDFYFVTCSPIKIVEIPAPIKETATAVTSTEPAPVTENPVSTPTQTQTTASDTATVVIDTATVLSDTSTVTFSNEFDWETFWIQFEIWFKTFFNEMWATP